MHYWRPRVGGGGGGGVLSAYGPGGVPSGKKGKGEALYYMS